MNAPDKIADFQFRVIVDAPRERVFEALTTHRGLKRWFTDHCEVNPGIGGESRFHFDGGYYVLRLDAQDAPVGVRWMCVDQTAPAPGGGNGVDDWIGTALDFALVSFSEKQTEIRFTHENLNSRTPNFNAYAARWVRLLGTSLRRYVESGQGDPHQNR
ncbi:SRPBCC domain-containing protein [bacterium]|nr:SRPBCC domain-containing protein [bacterium]MCB9479813.1 SRPBCC domain-containing protein [Deltaproteobacteria bacterium]